MKRFRRLLLTVPLRGGFALSAPVVFGLFFGCAADRSAPASTTPGAFKPGEDHEAKPGTLEDAQRDFEKGWESFQAAGNDCLTLCKALSSMKRAAEHLCAMSESGGEPEKKRCTDAKEKVATASTKVKETCGSC